MFGPSIFRVFRSRWQALWWASSILLLAYCSVPSPEETHPDQKVTDADMKAVEAALKDAEAALAE